MYVAILVAPLIAFVGAGVIFTHPMSEHVIGSYVVALVLVLLGVLTVIGIIENWKSDRRFRRKW